MSSPCYSFHIYGTFKVVCVRVRVRVRERERERERLKLWPNIAVCLIIKNVTKLVEG
jgi:hypothetical protein